MTAAISGAHTVGSAKLQNSGYEGFWSDPKNSGIFNNDYYWSLLYKGWAPKYSVNGNDNKNQWRRVDLGANDAHGQMMLTSDMCLGWRSQIKYFEIAHEKKPDWLTAHWQASVN